MGEPVRDEEGRLIVACDTSVLLNFLVIGRIELLAEHPRYRFVVTETVRQEVRRPEERSELERALGAGEIELLTTESMDELKLFSDLEAEIGAGEASAISVAACRGWCVAVDERGRTLRRVEELLGRERHLNTPGLLLRWIESGRLTTEEADAIKDELAENRFRMRFESFRDLLPRADSGGRGVTLAGPPVAQTDQSGTLEDRLGTRDP